MELQNLEVLRLHLHPEYLKPCCDLINKEWPRSETARMMSLKASCDELPTSLILINEEKRILGHCKLTPIPCIPESCFVETVVISNDMRGKKLGSYLMRKTEKYCKDVLKKEMLHLSTRGQECFYEKLGYTVCAPVSIYGTYVPSNLCTLVDKKCTNEDSIKVEPSFVVNAPVPPPPPPPPPPMPRSNISNNNNVRTNTTYMYKKI